MQLGRTEGAADGASTLMTQAASRRAGANTKRLAGLGGHLRLDVSTMNLRGVVLAVLITVTLSGFVFFGLLILG